MGVTLIDLSAISQRELLHAAPDPTVIVDGDGRILFASARVQDVFGHVPDALVGQPVEVLVPERFREAHRNHRSSYARTPRARPMGRAMELFGRHRDGFEFPVEVSLSPLHTPQGVLITSTIRDITERKQFEVSLARERSLLDSIISTAPTIVLLLDPEGLIQRANPYLEELTGYRAAELIGRDWFETMLPEDDREGIRAVFHRTLAQGFNPGYINPLRARDGGLLQIEWLAKTLTDGDGRLAGLLCIGRDVTGQLQHEQALKVAREDAERADASKSRFLAAASHDLRQPLQSLGLYLSVLSRLLDEPKPQEIAGKMRKSLDTMGELLDALLDISRLDSGSVIPEIEDFPIDTILDRIVTDNLQQAEEKGLVLECRATSCVVRSDAGLLERVIENLVTNAIRYTAEGAVRISCEPVDGRARVSVADTGVGIPEDALERVFDEYYQLDNPVRDRSKGLGLGLSIVRHIAHLLDLELDVTSVVGQGSTFTVAVEAGGQQPKSDASPIAATRLQGRDPVVLFVEDDEAVIDATTMLFESVGIRVHNATDGEAALDRIRDGLRPDLLVCDYRLPGVNGVEVVRRVQESLSKELPAVIMTGDTSAGRIDTGDLANFTLLHKPVDTSRLLGLVEDALGLADDRALTDATRQDFDA